MKHSPYFQIFMRNFFTGHFFKNLSLCVILTMLLSNKYWGCTAIYNSVLAEKSCQALATLLYAQQQ